jgi:hypothetical protein
MGRGFLESPHHAYAWPEEDESNSELPEGVIILGALSSGERPLGGWWYVDILIVG